MFSADFSSQATSPRRSGFERKAGLALLSLALAAGLTLSAKDARAADSDRSPQVVVTYSGLDLTSKRGAAILYGRLRSAAQQVCGGIDGSWPQQHFRFTQCVTESLSRAVADVNSTAVTARHQRAYGVDNRS